VRSVALDSGIWTESKTRIRATAVPTEDGRARMDRAVRRAIYETCFFLRFIVVKLGPTASETRILNVATEGKFSNARNGSIVVAPGTGFTIKESMASTVAGNSGESRRRLLERSRFCACDDENWVLRQESTGKNELQPLGLRYRLRMQSRGMRDTEKGHCEDQVRGRGKEAERTTNRDSGVNKETRSRPVCDI